MGFNAELRGRAALMRKLEGMAVDIDKYARDAKLKAAQELAEAVRQVAPVGATLEYREALEGSFLADAGGQKEIGIKATKDPSAAGLFGQWIWHFLEFGTAPHNTAKGGGTKAGKAAFAAGGGVMHPGTAAQPHIFTTYRAMKPKIRKMILAAVNKAVREAQGK